LIYHGLGDESGIPNDDGGDVYVFLSDFVGVCVALS